MWFAMTGYTREHWRARATLARAHSPEDWPNIEQPSAVTGPMRLIRSSMNIASERPPVSGSGCSIGARSRMGPRKQTAVIMGVALDVDAQKRIEAALRDSESRLHTAVWARALVYGK